MRVRKIVEESTLHPLLFAASVVLFAFAHNFAEVPLSDLWLPLALILLGTALVRWILHLLTRDRHGASLIATLLLPLFFSYGALYQLITFFAEGYLIDQRYFSHVFVISGLLILWALLGIAVLSFRGKVEIVTPLFNLCALLLVVFNLVAIASHAITTLIDRRQQQQLLSAERQDLRLADGIDTERQLPDIYYLVLDEYSGFDAIAEIFDFDNNDFADTLRQRGFFVAVSSSGLYSKTEKSLASTLNMRPLDAGDDPYVLLQNNHTVANMRKMGYSIVQFPINENMVFEESDRVLLHVKENKTSTVSDFSLFLLDRCMLKPLHDHLIESGELGDFHRRQTQFALDMLPTVATNPGPKFVFAHLSCPHFPFVFDREGGPVSPENYFNIREKEYYLGQVEFISREVIKVVDMIQAVPGAQPVIIIQSDHGHRGFAPTNATFTVKVGESWKNVLNAFYLPGFGYENIDPAISPIDTLELLFGSFLTGKNQAAPPTPTPLPHGL